ncbi:MAG: S9 family peptidase [Planctomycetales bacterium]|nr:S9 family peptidase [Planctomycetales bacterium]
MLRIALSTLLVISIMTSENSASAQESLGVPPSTRTVDHVDEYFGTKVADPYRWLEQDVRESEEVAEWVKTQNDYARSFLDKIPQRKKIEELLTKLWNYAKYSVPSNRGGRYFYQANSGLQNQSVLYVADSYRDAGRILLDPNTWSEDGTVALSGTATSEDGKYLAYAISEAGSDWKKLRILEIDSNEHLDETLQWLRWTSITWLKDGSGFYYNRFPEPKEGEQYQASALDQKIYFHVLGTPQSEDKLVYERPDHPDWGFGLELTEDGKYLVLSITKSTDDQNQVFYRNANDADGHWIELIDDFENQFWFIANRETDFYFLTDLNAPTKRIVSMSLDKPGRTDLTEIVPAAKETLEGVNVVNHQLITSYLKDASTMVKIYSMDGEFIRDVDFPGIGTASGFGGRPHHTETFYSFSSYATPPSTYRYDMKTGESELLRRSEVAFDADKYEVKQIFYSSKDGTRVPMFLAHRKGMKLDGNNPTLLYAYGGFNIPITPGFSISYAAWMEMGGVIAIANLRGGGEYGEEWHQAGKKEKKQNVFDDFIAAAEWLIENKYTKSSKLGIRGGSNGGLLVGAVMTQRPELFGACLPAVGVMDMLRFQKFTAGRYWVDEYGSSDNEKEFRTLIQYSPYHNIKSDVKYPATLVSTADTDDRVVPMHSFKFAARLQKAQSGDKPILIRIESRAGHGAGTPTSKLIEGTADYWTFLAWQLGVNLED